MNLQSLIGQTFLEAELFELLLSDIEVWPAQYDDVHCHLYLERVRLGVVRVSEIRNFADGDELDRCSRTIIEKREWIQIDDTEYKILMILIRLDRTGWAGLSRHHRLGTYISDWEHAWADEGPPLLPLTEEEIRLGIQELCGLFESETAKGNSKSKVAI